MISRRRRRLVDKNHLIGMSIVATVLSAGLTYLFLHVDFLPHSSSSERELIDRLLKVLLSIAGIFFSVITTVFAYSLIFFRRRRGDTEDAPPRKGYMPLEVLWTLLPLGVVIALSVYGGSVLDKMGAPGAPDSELEVNVTAFRFGWQFEYPQYNITSFELALPVDRRVVFSIQSRDVVHSFWVPEFGPKQDAVPGMTTNLRITPTRTGSYTVRCAELCGYGHTFMTAPCSVVSADDFDAWVRQQQGQQ